MKTAVPMEIVQREVRRKAKKCQKRQELSENKRNFRKVRKANRCKSIKPCAAGLAKIAAAMANGGSLGGVKVLFLIRHGIFSIKSEGAWRERLAGTSCKAYQGKPWQGHLGSHPH